MIELISENEKQLYIKSKREEVLGEYADKLLHKINKLNIIKQIFDNMTFEFAFRLRSVNVDNYDEEVYMDIEGTLLTIKLVVNNDGIIVRYGVSMLPKIIVFDYHARDLNEIYDFILNNIPKG